jgi:glycerate dehydrogenase
MKIVFLDKASLGGGISFGSIEKQGDFTAYDYTAPTEIKERIADADIVIVNKVIMGKEQMDSAPKMRLICVAATGMNNIDLACAAEKGIVVKNAVDYSTESVVQITFASLLSLISKIAYYDNCVKSKTYCKSRHFTDTGKQFSEISGKKFGIIGMGNIGKRVAAVASAFGADVQYYSTGGTPHCKDYKHVSFEELLSTSDIISVHAPLNEKTKDLIKEAELRKMKPSAVIANLGRGGIINEQDLAYALNNNVIAGAVADVYSVEPISDTHPYLSVNDSEKIILTPHIAWASTEARECLVAKIAENIGNFLKTI